MGDHQLLNAWLGAEPFAWLASAGAFAVAISATPGPNNTMVAASGASFGFIRTLPHMAGVILGFALMVAVIGLGGAGLLQRFPLIHQMLKWIAAAYLLWLAWRIAVARPTLEAGTTDKAGQPISFLQAALFQWVNPKAWVAAVSAVSVYTSVSRPILPQAAILTALFAAISIPSVALWTGIGAGAGKLLRTPSGLKAFNIAMALLLAGSVISLVSER